jgi:hypothetical protein
VENEELSPGECPDDELLAGLIENRIDEVTRVTLERHVATCSACADVVAAVAASTHDPSLLTAERSPVAPPPAARAPTTAPTIEQPPAAARAGRPRRPTGRRRLALAAGLALAATAALGYGGAILLLDRATGTLARRASDLIGQPVAIGRVAIRVGSDLRTLTVQLADVHLGAGSPTSSSAAGVEVALAIAPLWRGSLGVERVRLIRPVLYAGEQPPAAAPEREREAGRLGLDTRSVLSTLLGGSRFEIADGTLVASLPDGPPLTVTRVNATSAPTADGVQIALAGALAGGSVMVDGTLATDGTLALSADGRGLPLAALPYVRARLSGIVDFHLTATGNARAPRLAGRALVRAGHALAWNPLSVLLEPAGATTLAGLVPTLASGAFPFDELHVAFAAHRGDWRIRRVHVTSAGVAASGQLRVTASRGVSGAGAVHLPPGLTAPLVTAMPRLAARREADGGITLPYSIGGTIDAPQFAPRF